MASIATPKFLNEQDRAYNEQFQKIYFDHLNKRRPRRLSYRGQQLVERLDKTFENVERTFPPVEEYDHLWQGIAYDISTLPFREVRPKARHYFCLRHNNLAWLLGKPRRKFLEWRTQYRLFDASDFNFASLAMEGEIFYGTVAYEEWPFPSMRTLENWLEDFDLPEVQNIDQNSPWHTLQEWVVLCAHFEVKKAPKTMMEMRKFVRKLGDGLETKQKKGKTLYKDIIINHLSENPPKPRRRRYPKKSRSNIIY